jgi:hypothetical protein
MYGDYNGLNTHLIGKTIGPWPCSECKKTSQFARIGTETNYIFCRNESCGFERIVDKKNSIIVEPDGSFWKFDEEGNKIRIRAL